MATQGIERISIPGGSLLLNRGFAGADAVLAFVRAGGFLDPAHAPEPLATAQPGTRATKLAVPGVGACVLKEMFVPPEAGFRRRFRIWFRMAVRRKFRRTFLVSAAARAAGIPVYEPYAYWTDRRGGLRMFFLCEFVAGPSFEDLCRGMRYRAEDRDAVLAGFRTLGGQAARLHAAGIANSDMIPRNCIVAGADEAGRPALKLIDLDLSRFIRRKGRRAFVSRMRSFHRFVIPYGGVVPLDADCLDAFLGAYSGGDADTEARCRRALSVIRRHPRRKTLASLRVFLMRPPRAIPQS